MCSVYKPTLRYCLWLHSFVIVIVDASFLYRRNTKWLDPKAKLMPLQVFQANVASSLVEAHKGKRGRNWLKYSRLQLIACGKMALIILRTGKKSVSDAVNALMVILTFYV